MNNMNSTGDIEIPTISVAYFHRLLKRFGVVYMAIVIIFGIIGNSISCYVFVRSKLKRLSCSSYLIALSLSDNGYLICLSLIWLENVHLYIFHNHGICQFGVYLTTVCSSLSVWFTVAFTTERFVVVAYPLKRSQYNSLSRSRYVILLLTALAFLLYSSSLWASGIEEAKPERRNSSLHETRCVTLPEWLKFTRHMNIIDFFLTFIIPFLTILTLNTLIIFKSGQYDRLLERNYIQPSTYILHNLLEHRLRRSKYHRRITKMLLIISTTFLLLNTPMHLLKIYYFFFSIDDTNDSTESIIEMLTFYLFYTNFSINFFLYSLCGKNFRSCLMDLIQHIGKNKQTTSFFSNVGDNPLVQYYQRSHDTRHNSRFSKRELSSTLSSGGINGNAFMSTSNLTTAMATGISQQTLHPSSSASSFKKSSLKIELLTPTVVKFYPTFTIK
ncbi:unnamed protein product [Rotaria sordida]|uniref:G-protein coupled receptors family 1 profile domain-containing protein n=3 Tax=Rotaria sordida TaxID=392033 RepID=A0A814SUB7_9BILA|nr:unnamed protein product [Rotaria sordida]CAF1152607.1 unnamed protein product [Rotaria sordida]CAF1199165.1 unnamed protein product [Rotaria sordida]CAF1393400.1 unnamed protein product [Rotaria sordida]CAF3935549.1 unnamed protein product [Rotaria sordida]